MYLSVFLTLSSLDIPFRSVHGQGIAPDIVAPVTRSLAVLDAAVSTGQQRAVFLLFRLLPIGCSRWIIFGMGRQTILKRDGSALSAFRAVGTNDGCLRMNSRRDLRGVTLCTYYARTVPDLVMTDWAAALRGPWRVICGVLHG